MIGDPVAGPNEFQRFVPRHFTLLTMFTSMYIHSGIGHIFGNMLFLWIVGDNVEDRLGHLGYFAFYHLAGAAATLGPL